MNEGSDQPCDVKNLLQRYVEMHNRGAVHGDVSAVTSVLEDGLEIAVEGESLSSLRQEAMVRAFREHEVVLWQIGSVGDDVAFANYAWRDHPRIGGLIRVQRSGDRISRLTLRPGYSRIFALVAEPGDGGDFLKPGGADAFASP